MKENRSAKTRHVTVYLFPNLKRCVCVCLCLFMHACWNISVADSPKHHTWLGMQTRERERERFENREKRINKWLKKTQFSILLLSLHKLSGVPTPLFRGSTPTRVGGPWVLPREFFFHLRWLNPLKFNSQAARFMPLSDRETKGTITLKYCAVHKRFTPHSYWEVIRWAKWLSVSNSTLPTERDSRRSRVFLPPYFKAETMGNSKKSRQLQVLLGRNHLLFVVEIYQTFTFSSFVFSLYEYNSQAQPMSTARRRPAQIDHGKGASTGRYARKKCYMRSGPQADKLLRSRPSSHVDARPSTTKDRTRHALALHV